MRTVGHKHIRRDQRSGNVILKIISFFFCFTQEDLLIHGDSAYDIIDKADHGTVQAELLRSSNVHNPPGNDARLFLCRMNVSRNARRQMRFGDQKVRSGLLYWWNIFEKV